MQYPKIPLAQTVIQLCKAKNVQNIIISPGSRSAPLTIGFSNDNYFNCYSIVDERCAAFFALGMAQKLQHPTALVCTSGSALLNYYPAIAEAYYSDIPLVILSADRSEYLIGIGDGQTINQPDVFKNHILCSVSLKQNLENIPKKANDDEPAIIKSIENKLERFLGIKQQIKEENEAEINMALNTALIKNGPVHINIPFEEPLYEVTGNLSEKPKSVEMEVKPKIIDAVDLDACLDDWNSASKKMILVGVNSPNTIAQKWLDKLASDNSVIVFTETTSNLHHKEFFPSIDKIIAPLADDEFKQLQPDILLTFGGLVVSKKIKAFLRKYKPKHHWHVDKKKANDTFFCLEKHIEASPNQFFSEFLPKLTHVKKSSYKPFWNQVKQHRQERHNEYLNEIQFSDFKAFDTILKAIPKNVSFQVGNSSAIRYTQLFNLKNTIDVYCNRGTSGIDGCTSTAIGFATMNTKQTVFITGDLSFFYDSNALWNNYIPKNFRIILINNSGGGIFRILPGNKNSDNFDTYFETKHNLSAKQLSEMFGFEYYNVNNDSDLHEQLAVFFDRSNKPKLLEIATPRTVNDEVLLTYFNYIK